MKVPNFLKSHNAISSIAKSSSSDSLNFGRAMPGDRAIVKKDVANFKQKQRVQKLKSGLKTTGIFLFKAASFGFKKLRPIAVKSLKMSFKEINKVSKIRKKKSKMGWSY